MLRLPLGMHIGVVDVEVVLVVVEVVGVVVDVDVVGVVVDVLVDVEVVLVEVLVVLLVVLVVVCVWQVPLEQLPLQHCLPFVQVLPLRLQPGGEPGGAAVASPMPSDASVLPTRTAPISLNTLPRVTLPSASPLASSSQELALSSWFIGYTPLPLKGGTPQPRLVRVSYRLHHTPGIRRRMYRRARG
jgi:hypothetical protein